MPRPDQRLRCHPGPRRRAPSEIGPYRVTVPAARRYLPGGLILETAWQTHTGWVIVRDALVMGPWHDIDPVPYASPHPDWDAEHAHRALREQRVELVMSCEPAFDYHRNNATWE